jgi:hypothetical protein
MKDLKQYLEALCPECGKDHEGKCATEAVTRAQRLARKKAHLKKTMKKYGDATKMGMDPAQVNQRRNRPTLKKR